MIDPHSVSYRGPMSDDEYIDVVYRIQQAMAIEPFHPPVIDVAKLLADWMEYKNELARLRTWAEDEQAKRHRAEDQRLEARSEAAYAEAVIARLRANPDINAVRAAWQAWKDAWGTGDSEEAYALMEMDSLLGVDDQGNVLDPSRAS